MHFGLGPASSISRIEIRWPSGIKQVLSDVKADQILTITEAKSTSK
jgi:enediyne biosynthesis protein E4